MDRIRSRLTATLRSLALVVALMDPISARGQQLLDVIELGQEFIPLQISGNDSIHRFYLIGISEQGERLLGILDGNTNALELVDLGFDVFPGSVAANRATGEVFVASDPSVLQILDAFGGSRRDVPLTAIEFLAFGAPPSPRWLDVNGQTNTAYIFDWSRQAIGLYDVETQVVSPIELTDVFPLALAVNSSTNRAYVPAQSLTAEGELLVINGADLSVESISLGIDLFPNQAVAVNAVTNTIYLGGTLAGPNEKGLAIVNGADNTFRTLSLGTFEAQDLAVNPATNEVFAIGFTFDGDAQLVTIDGSDDSVSTFSLGTSGFFAAGLAVNRFTNRVYVAGNNEFGEQQVLVFGGGGCASSGAETLDGLIEAVSSLPTSAATLELLSSSLAAANRALDRGDNAAARLALTRFIRRLVRASNKDGADPDSLDLATANGLVCSASSILAGIAVP